MKDQLVDLQVDVTRKQAKKILNACLLEISYGNITAKDITLQYRGKRQTARQLLIATYIVHSLKELAKKCKKKK